MAEEIVKEVKRGYVKWTDENGVFHKEPLVDHPELLAKASPEEQLAAEEARRLNAAAEEFLADREEDGEEAIVEALADLKAAPEEVLTASQLTEEAPMSGAEDPGEKSGQVETLQEPAATDPNDQENVSEHDRALAELREATAE